MEEIWKEIVGFEGKYWVSTLGNVKNKKRMLKALFSRSQPYPKYHLAKGNGLFRYAMGHRLVAETFLDNPNEYPIVHHKDNNPKNNRVDNLEWCTYSQNTNYAVEAGNFKQRYTKINNPSLRLTDLQITGARRLKQIGWSLTEIADILNCSRGYVSEIINDKKRANS